jgi:hypothetical protein
LCSGYWKSTCKEEEHLIGSILFSIQSKLKCSFFLGMVKVKRSSKCEIIGAGIKYLTVLSSYALVPNEEPSKLHLIFI